MANRKISDLTALTAPATGDLLPIVDISEAAAADKNKKITFGELLSSAPAGTAAAPSFSFDADPNTGMFNPAADTLAFAEGGVEAMRIDASGRLLVGTSSTSKSNLVQINQANQGVTTGNANLGIYTTDSQGANIGAKLALGGQSAEANWLYGSISGRSENNSYAGYLQFGVSDSIGNHNEACRINSGQEVLIGYTTDNGAYKLQVNSQIFATSAIIATSDGRYKENVATLGGCLNLVKALRPVSFTWKPQEDITRTDNEGNEVLVRECHNFPKGTQVGFIAQEVQDALAGKSWLNSVIKENVRPAVLDNEDNELAPEERFFGIAEGNLIAVLTNALQEAVVEIESLKDRVAALEGQ
jgi:hypothetical protein